MTCRDVHREVLELARGGREATSATHARAHLVNCASCRERFAQQQALSAGLRAMAIAAQADAPSGELDRRVMLAFGREQPSIVDPGRLDDPVEARESFGVRLQASRFRMQIRRVLPEARSPKPDRLRQGYGGPPKLSRDGPAKAEARGFLRTPWNGWMRLAAGLAAVAVAASWWAFRGSDGNMVASRLPSRPIARLQGEVMPSPEARPVGQRSASPLPVRQRTARHQTPHLLSPEGFMSLPAAAGLPDFERGEILRLEIAVASLPNYGVEIPPDAENRPIEVDILVGQDGHPRAIRLVHLKARMTYGETPARTLPVR